MAGKTKTMYICSQCGYESAKWFGCCPGCSEWNTMEFIRMHLKLHLKKREIVIYTRKWDINRQER